MHSKCALSIYSAWNPAAKVKPLTTQRQTVNSNNVLKENQEFKSYHHIRVDVELSLSLCDPNKYPYSEGKHFKNAFHSKADY